MENDLPPSLMAWETVDDGMGWHPLLHLLTRRKRENYGKYECDNKCWCGTHVTPTSTMVVCCVLSGQKSHMLVCLPCVCCVSDMMTCLFIHRELSTLDGWARRVMREWCVISMLPHVLSRMCSWLCSSTCYILWSFRPPFSWWLFLLISQSVLAVVWYLAFVVVAMCFSLPVCLLKSTHKYVTWIIFDPP